MFLLFHFLTSLELFIKIEIFQSKIIKQCDNLFQLVTDMICFHRIHIHFYSKVLKLSIRNLL